MKEVKRSKSKKALAKPIKKRTLSRAASIPETKQVPPPKTTKSLPAASPPVSVKKTKTPLSSRKKSISKSEVHLVPEPNQKLKIAMVASECTPYAKSGGLADAVAGLSKTLHDAGHSVRIIIPLYGQIDRAKWKIEFRHPICIHMGQGEEQWIGLFEGLLDGKVPVWFVDYERFFSRPGIYDHNHHEYTDNPYRFALLSKASMQICKDMGFIPDVMHCHDWPSALVPAFLKTWDRVFSPLSRTASALTIHNIGYQGKFPAGVWNYWGMGPEHFHADIFEDFGAVNLLKGGIFFADALTTVSPTHAREIMEPIGGQGLAPAVARRSEDFVGILNGVDIEHWNPSTDSLIPASFDPSDLRGKVTCKTALQKEFGLEVRADIPVFGLVSRFVHQKGLSLIQEILPTILETMVAQFIFLGSGDPSVETWVVEMMARYPGKVGGYIGFSNKHAHLIEAGSDFFLMPSLYEPCGLNQIYSLKYGTLPVVRATGGLDDTVIAYHEPDGSGTGFKFHEPIGHALLHTIGLVVATWYDRPHHIAKMRAAAMAQHFTWEDVLPEYIKMYQQAIHRRSLWG
ncbi:MAG: glycogen/starch synthase [Verrucomicrobiota bacterium]